MKYNVSADGNSASVDIEYDGKGGFTGAIHTADGQHNGNLSGTVADNVLTGAATLDGHNGTFQATISEKAVSGAVTVNVFLFHKTVSFTGTQAA